MHRAEQSALDHLAALRGSDDTRKLAIANLPPTFRIARHHVAEPGDKKRPPTFETAYQETETRPGRRVEASDRAYVCGDSGELRRLVSARGRRQRQPGKGETVARARQVERLERELATASRRRAHRALASTTRKLNQVEDLQRSVQTLRSRLRGGLSAKGQVCTNCGEPGAHFVPPSLGEPGFYACERQEATS